MQFSWMLAGCGRLAESYSRFCCDVFALAPRVTIAGCLLLTGASATFYYGYAIWIFAVVALATIVSVWSAKRRLGAALIAMVCLLGALRGHEFVIASGQDWNVHNGARLTGYCRIVRTLPAIGKLKRAIVEVEGLDGGLKFPSKLKMVLLSNERHAYSPYAGVKLRFGGRLYRPMGRTHPWEFDEAAYLRRFGVTCSLLSHDVAELKGAQKYRPSLVDNVCVWLDLVAKERRQWIVQFHEQNLGTAYGALLSSMVIGDRAVQLPDDLVERFRNAGLSHLLAASGFNLTVVVGTSWFLLRPVVPITSALCSISFFFLISFVLLAGPSPSVERAAIMCSAMLLARCQSRRVHVGAVLSLALAVMMLVDLASIADVGLQLSFSVTAAIVCGARPTAESLRKGLRGAPHYLVDALAIIFLAQAAAVPLQLLYFGYFGLLSIPLNLLMAPLVPIVSVMGFASSFFVAVVGTPMSAILCSWVDKIALAPLFLLDSAVRLACVPGTRMVTHCSGLLSVFFYYAALGLWIWSMRRGTLVLISSLLFLTASVVIFLPQPSSLPILVCYKRLVVIVDEDKVARWHGDDDDNTLQRIITYFDARPAATPHLTCDTRAQRLGGHTVVILDPINHGREDIASSVENLIVLNSNKLSPSELTDLCRRATPQRLILLGPGRRKNYTARRIARSLDRAITIQSCDGPRGIALSFSN